MKRQESGLCVLTAMVMLCPLSASGEIRLRITGGETDYEQVPISASIQLPRELRESELPHTVMLVREGSPRMFCQGQIIKTLDNTFELWCVLPRLEAGASGAGAVHLSPSGVGGGAFAFEDRKGHWLDLSFGGQPVTRFMYAHDASTPQRRFETYKPFLHVYDRSGQRLTNGPDGESEYAASGIRYPHHRGIFIGWNRLGCQGKRYDLWHMKGVEQIHQEFLEQVAGGVLARTTSRIHWNDDKGNPILVERRTTTVYRQSKPNVALIDFDTLLTAVGGDVELNGDPEHAGIQYRAHNDVAAGGKEVKAQYLFHADGIDPRKDLDLPWAAMGYGLDRRYVVQHMNHPKNPKGTLYSAYRDYGRFGAFFKGTIKKGETLPLRYRIWVGQRSAPGRDRCASRYAAYVNPPKVEVLP